jgi:AcrR family transcriptional regulator
MPTRDSRNLPQAQGPEDTPKASPARPRRGPRPSVEVRDLLLRAAAELVTERGAEDIPLRLVAERAGVTPAMVTYYFEGKDGLWDALIVSGMQAVRAALAPAVKPGQAVDLTAVLREMMETLHARPWVPRLVLRSLWGAPKHRSHVAEEQAPANVQVLRALLARATVDGRPVRTDVPHEAIAVVLVSSMVFPVLARPVLERALGRPFDDDLRQKLAHGLATLLTQAEVPS